MDRSRPKADLGAGSMRQILCARPLSQDLQAPRAPAEGAKGLNASGEDGKVRLDLTNQGASPFRCYRLLASIAPCSH